MKEDLDRSEDTGAKVDQDPPKDDVKDDGEFPPDNVEDHDGLNPNDVEDRTNSIRSHRSQLFLSHCPSRISRRPREQQRSARRSS